MDHGLSGGPGLRERAHLDTRLAQIGSRGDRVTGAISFPIYQAAVYRHPRFGESTGFQYGRLGNPTRTQLEAAVAEIEGAARAFACSSGMAAIHLAMSLFSPGDRILVSADLYGQTYRLFEAVLARLGLKFSYVESWDLQKVKEALTPDARGFFIETPTNPLMRITDLRALTALAKERGMLTVVDNTLMTAWCQRPLELGADVVVYSATKYLGGHNDVVAGLVAAADEEVGMTLEFFYHVLGAILAPQECWLLMRGMKTLSLRMARQQENAMSLAQFLRGHPLVTDVYYPGLPDHPGREVHDRQARGYGGLLSFRVRDPRLVEPILNNVQIISFAESLGGVESLMTLPARQTHQDIPESVRRRTGVDECLLRVAVGIEHGPDLIADLEQALERAAAEVGLA